jgi:predicted nucleic acid-binding protein
MAVLVDTCIWSLALRRQKQVTHDAYTNQLKSLILANRATLIGPIRQEILSGMKNSDQFTLLKQELTAFPDIPLQTNDYENAAEFYNLLQRKGIQGSNTDFLICAIAIRCDIAIFTSDKDFLLFAKHIPIQLFPM